MKKNVKNPLFVTFLLVGSGLLSACANQPVSDRPNWLVSPAKHQVVGSCGTHALGLHKQKECAISRARLELAARNGIVIKAVTVMTENATNLSSQSTLNGQVIQEVNGTIKTRLIDTYHDKAQDIIWVLVEEN